MLILIKKWLKDSKKLKFIFLLYLSLLSFSLLKSNIDSFYHSLNFLNLKIPFGDKYLHFFAFLFLTLLGMLSFKNKPIIFYLFIFTLYGGIIEIMQEYFVQGRSGDIFDLFADCTGIVFALVLYNKLSNFI